MTLVTKTRKSPVHKKRTGSHHRQSKHYHKAYYPYLPVLFLIVGAGLLLSSFWGNQSHVLGSKSDFSIQKLAQDTNTQRSKNHLMALTIDSSLSEAAQAKANDMIKRNYWSHTTPDSKAFSSFIVSSGYSYQTAGENLAYGFNDASQVIKGWMNSPEHRDNILSSTYQNVGFGVASSKNFLGKGPAVVVVAEYGQPAAVANIKFTVKNPVSGEVKGDTAEAATQNVSRIQLLTGGSAMWSLAAISAIMGAAFALLLMRHGYMFHRAFVKGEKFIVKHLWMDMAFVLVITAGFVLTRTSGLIH